MREPGSRTIIISILPLRVEQRTPTPCMRRYRALVLVLILVGCDRQLHRLFEAPPPPYIRLSITLDASTITLARGEERMLTVTVTRTGEDRGPASLTFEGTPAGLTASTKSSSV